MSYPSIYRAKAIQFDGTTLVAYVPQVFGDVTIEITDIIGAVEPGMGWVFFQAGDPEFPVWMSGVAAAEAAAEEEDDGSSIFITRDYRWLNQVTTSDPGSGRVKVDSYDPVGASQMCISAYDMEGTAYLTLLSLTEGDLLAVYLNGDVGTRIEYTLAGSVVNHTTWLEIPLDPDPVNHGFDTSTPGNNVQVKVTVQTTGGGGGSGGSGTDEVWVGTADPIGANPTIELWVDTDEPTVMTDDMRWNTAWGIVATGSWLEALTGTVFAANSSLSVPLTFTGQVGRKYRFRCCVRAIAASVAGGLWIRLMVDGGGPVPDVHQYTAGQWQSIVFEVPFNGDGLSHTYLMNNAVACTAHFGQSTSFIYIEDVGPVSGSVSIPSPTPAWTTLTLQNAWVLWSGTRSPNTCRKLGDVVWLRLNASGGANGTTLVTLPAGFRPPYILDIMGRDSNGAAVININPDGTVVWYGTGTGFVTLNTSFPVTP